MRQRLTHTPRLARKPWRRSESARHVTVRCRRALLRQIDEWRRRQKDVPTRSEAIQRLVAMAIRGSKAGIIIVSSGPHRENGNMKGIGETDSHGRLH